MDSGRGRIRKTVDEGGEGDALAIRRPGGEAIQALVRTDGPAFRAFEKERERWAEEDCYVFPGAIQYFGPPEVSDRPAETILLERGR